MILKSWDDANILDERRETISPHLLTIWASGEKSHDSYLSNSEYFHISF